MFTRELGFEITTRCPLACSHCIVESSPARRETVADALGTWLGDGAALEGIAVVVATGGEPFLYPKALGELSRLARARSCRFRVVTSASWARTEEGTEKMLARVPIDHLVVSFDEYHREYQTFTPAANALCAAVRHGIQATLNVVAPSRDLDSALARVRSDLAVVMGDVSDAVEVTGQPLMRAGRGLAVLDSRLHPWQAFDSCPMAAQHVVKTNGDVIACCGPPAYRTERPIPWLLLGNVASESLSEILLRAQRDVLVRAIHLFGPRMLYELASPRSHKLGERFDTRCSLCTAVLTDDDLMVEVAAALAQPAIRRRVALAAALVGDLALLELETGTPTEPR